MPTRLNSNNNSHIYIFGIIYKKTTPSVDHIAKLVLQATIIDFLE
jgi:hypothetical protein